MGLRSANGRIRRDSAASKRTQPADDTGERVEHVVDLLFRIVRAECEAKRRMGQVGIDAHGGEHVRRFEGTGGAGAARAGGDACHIECEEDAFAFDVAEAAAEVVRETAIGASGAGDDGVGYALREFEQEPVPERSVQTRLFPLEVLLHPWPVPPQVSGNTPLQKR